MVVKKGANSKIWWIELDIQGVFNMISSLIASILLEIPLITSEIFLNHMIDSWNHTDQRVDYVILKNTTSLQWDFCLKHW